MANRRITIEIAGDASGASKAFDAAGKDAKGFEGSISGVAKGVATSVGSAFALDQIVSWGSTFVGAADESKKVASQTEAVIKSMGGAANVSAEQAAGLAEELSGLTGVDDELIQSGENVLMTFGRVRNEVGAGNDIFDRATKAALDMSAALGTDMTQASMLVGKALNDPIAGLTALRRSGIQFTEQQRDQIEAMVEAGDVAGAQKIMLEELERQFGGSAEAQATATDKMRVAWGNFQEEVGGKVAPAVGVAADALSGLVEGPAGDAAATATAVALGLGAVAAAGGVVIGPIQTAREALANLGTTGASVNTTLGRIGRGLAVGGAIYVGLEAIDRLIGAVADSSDEAPANVDKLALSLQGLARSGQLSGEGLETFGEDWSQLKDDLSTIDLSGVESARASVDRFVSSVPLAGRAIGTDYAENVDKARDRVKALDDALVALNAVDPTAAATNYQSMLDATGLSASQAESLFEGYTGALAANETQQNATSTEVQNTTDALKEQADALRAQFDPLFGMVDAQFRVKDAQAAAAQAARDLSAAEAEHGASSREAIEARDALTLAEIAAGQAAVGLTSAAYGLKAAVEAGDVSVEDATAALQGMVSQGIITQDQANQLATSFGGAAAQANALAVDRSFSINATDNASEKIGNVLYELSKIPAQKDILIRTFGSLPGIGPLLKNAAGGEVDAGVPGWVGEAGKEIFIPEVDGRILSHADSMRAIQAGGGGVATAAGGDTFIFDLSGAVIAGESQFRQMVASAWNDAAAMGAVHVRGRRVE